MAYHALPWLWPQVDSDDTLALVWLCLVAALCRDTPCMVLTCHPSTVSVKILIGML